MQPGVSNRGNTQIKTQIYAEEILLGRRRVSVVLRFGEAQGKCPDLKGICSWMTADSVSICNRDNTIPRAIEGKR